MVDITATRARLVDQAWAERVPSPAYDAMTPQQRRRLRLANPWSFLNVTLSPEDVNEPVSDEQLLTLARESLDRILATGAFDTAADPALYLYRLRNDSHEQTGLIADIAIGDYASGAVRIHEQVREKRARLLSEHMLRLGVSSSPIALAYQNTQALTSLMDQIQSQDPTLVIAAEYGVEQTIWRISEPHTVAQFQEHFRPQTLYIIDGHHRAAACLEVHEKAPSAQSSQLFGVMFPHDSLRLRGFNRWISEPGKANLARLSALIDRLGAIAESYRPPVKGQTLVFLNDQWYTVPLPGDEFDSQKLYDQILAPCFDLSAPDDPRIINLPAADDVLELQRAAAEASSAAFVLAPLTIEEFLQAADSQVLLPPKSTYFVPKAQSGVFLRELR